MQLEILLCLENPVKRVVTIKRGEVNVGCFRLVVVIGACMGKGEG